MTEGEGWDYLVVEYGYRSLNLAKVAICITPAKVVFSSISILLAVIRVRSSSATRYPKFTCSQDTTINELDHVEFWLAWAGVCAAIYRGMGGR